MWADARRLAMSAVSASVSASASNTTSQNPNDIFGSATTINFGQGVITLPTENTVTAANPTTSEPVTTATAAQGNAASSPLSSVPNAVTAATGISPTTLILVSVGLGVAAIALIVFLEIRKK